MLFTFIIPIYNSLLITPSILKRASCFIEKLDCEVLFVDDCSNDGTYEFLSTNIKNEKNIKLCKTSVNSGPGNARNIGISLALGKYIIFIDSDDILEFVDNINIGPELLILRDHEAIDVICIKSINENRPNDDKLIITELNNTIEAFNLRSNVNYKNFPSSECWGFIFSSSFLKLNKIAFPEIRIAEDQVFMIKVRLKLKSLASTTIFNYIHTANSYGLSMQFNKHGMLVYMNIVQMIMDLINLESESNLDFLIIKLHDVLHIFFCYLMAFCEDISIKEIENIFDVLNHNNADLKINKIASFINFQEFISYRQLILSFIKIKANSLNLYCLSNLSMSVACMSERLNIPVITIIDDNRVKMNELESVKFGAQLRNSTAHIQENDTILICHSDKNVVRKIFLGLKNASCINLSNIFAFFNFINGPIGVKYSLNERLR